MDVAPSFLKAGDVLLGTPGGLLDLFSPGKGTGSSNSNNFKKLLDHNNIICLQEVHGKDEFLQAIQVLGPRFRFFGTFLPDNENAGGSAICIHRDLLLEDTLVTQKVTSQGRDHLVTIRSGRHYLVMSMSILNLNSLQGSYAADWVLFIHIGLHIPVVWELFWAISTFVTQKKDDLTSGTRHPPMATREKLLCSILSFHMSLRLPNVITPGEMPRPLETYALCQGLLVSLSIYLWLRHVISTARLMLLRTLGRKLPCRPK